MASKIDRAEVKTLSDITIDTLTTPMTFRMICKTLLCSIPYRTLCSDKLRSEEICHFILIIDSSFESRFTMLT